MKKELISVSHKGRITDALSYIQENLFNNLTLEEVASHASYSKDHFNRIFKQVVGESFLQYYKRVKMESAIHKMRHHKCSITETAFDLNYENVESFSRAFKKQFGISPKHYSQIQAVKDRKLYTDYHSITKHENSNRSCDFEIVKLDDLFIAYATRFGPYTEGAKSWVEIELMVNERKLSRADHIFLGIAYDDPKITPTGKERFDACITVNRNFLPPENIRTKIIKGRRYVKATHYGSYETIGETYDNFFYEFFPNSKEDCESDAFLEIYITTLDEVTPNELITELYVPLK